MLKDKLFGGNAWAAPGAILRRSMLEYLASQVGGLPPELEVGRFTTADPGKGLRAEEEDIAKRSLAVSFDLKQLRDDAEDEVENEDAEECNDFYEEDPEADEGKELRVMRKILGFGDEEDTRLKW